MKFLLAYGERMNVPVRQFKKEGAVKHIPIYFLFFRQSKSIMVLTLSNKVEALNRMWALIKHSNIRLENS